MHTSITDLFASIKVVLIRYTYIIGVLFIAGCFLSCKSSKINKNLRHNFSDTFYETQFTGILVIDSKTKDTVFSYNANKYFIPASNVKIATLYTALQFLPDSIPAVTYRIENDTITLKGTGDPSFLHSFFKDSTVLKLAYPYKYVNLIVDNIVDAKYGPGWAWEDYDTYFSPERSSFPMYGNVLTISNTDSLTTIPKLLEKKTQYAIDSPSRAYNDNAFYYKIGSNKKEEIPMVMDSILIQNLWETLVPGNVTQLKDASKTLNQTAYSIPSDSLYKRMMQVSDNFLAEQILMLASSTISDTLNTNLVRTKILAENLKDLKQQPRWVDGSGLSRYNLFTPTSLVQILTKLYEDVSKERLFNLFPVGGNIGTLKNWYGSNGKPYVYAKSGSVGNNYNLSGYLLTTSGKTLIFSFMNNHYLKSSSEVKTHMQTILEMIRDAY